MVDALHGEVPAALLFPADPDRVPVLREPGPRRLAADRFETLSWTSERPVSLPRLQQRSAGWRRNSLAQRGCSRRWSSPGG